MKSLKTSDVIVVGGGPAGMMAAITAAENGCSVTLIERNSFTGKKLNITGKGRCNISNNCAPADIIKNTPRNGKFLYSAVNRFSSFDTIDFFESNGLATVVERGNRVFPASDKARDVTDTLRALMRANGVTVLEERVNELVYVDGTIRGVKTDKQEHLCKAVILATGGLSYPLTGSTGDGYKLAKNVGHTVIAPVASIVPLTSDDPSCAQMQGLALKNIGVKAFDKDGVKVYEDFGELLFTHYGMSGPVILSMSAHLRNFDNNRYYVSIDLKPALNEKKLDLRILRDFEKFKNRAFSNSLGDLLHKSMIDVIIERTGIDPATPTHSVSKAERRTLLQTLKDFRITVSGARPIDEAVVTSGGISVKEIDPNTMESSKLPGLFFAGEIIDVDAYTGGYNLQIAWSTGRAAGLGVCQYLSQ